MMGVLVLVKASPRCDFEKTSGSESKRLSVRRGARTAVKRHELFHSLSVVAREMK